MSPAASQLSLLLTEAVRAEREETWIITAPSGSRGEGGAETLSKTGRGGRSVTGLRKACLFLSLMHEGSMSTVFLFVVFHMVGQR